jgi:hypothetical protein
MASSACCDAGQPVTSDYTPSGSFGSVGDLPTYTTGAGEKGVIIVYDIFGFAYNQVGTVGVQVHSDPPVR